jgi:transposase
VYQRKRFEFSVFSDDWNAGVSVKAIAEKHGVNVVTVYKAIRTAGATRKRSYTHPEEVASSLEARAKQMVRAYGAGLSLEKIGEIHGVTRERVRQIISARGITRFDGGPSLKAAAQKAARAARRAASQDERCLRVYGCIYAALEALIGAGVRVTSHKAARAYVQHKRNSDARGIEFSLTFPQWWAVWQKSGKWDERGRAKYVMARNGDIGAYSVGNVRICTSSENIKEGYIKTPASVRAAKRASNPAANNRTTLGRGRGYTILKRCTTRPYQVMCGKDRVGYFATEEEARAAYLAACEAKRLAATKVFGKTA